MSLVHTVLGEKPSQRTDTGCEHEVRGLELSGPQKAEWWAPALGEGEAAVSWGQFQLWKLQTY